MYKNYTKTELEKELNFFLDELKILEEKQKNINVSVELMRKELEKREVNE